MKRFALIALAVALFAPSAIASEDVREMSDESLLERYVELARTIELERAALEDERAWMEEERSRREVDDRIYDELAVIIDRHVALLDARIAELEARERINEAERAKIAREKSTPVRRYTIRDPLVKRDLEEKIRKYWHTY